mgnify:CR=1 FL=1
MHAQFFLSAPSKWVGPALGARADPNAEADIRVRLADPNGQKTDEIFVRLGWPVGVALRYVGVETGM